MRPKKLTRKGEKLAKAKAIAKFAKAAHLHEAGATKELRKISDSWDKRFSGNTTGFWKASEARK